MYATCFTNCNLWTMVTARDRAGDLVYELLFYKKVKHSFMLISNNFNYWCLLIFIHYCNVIEDLYTKCYSRIISSSSKLLVVWILQDISGPEVLFNRYNQQMFTSTGSNLSSRYYSTTAWSTVKSTLEARWRRLVRSCEVCTRTGWGQDHGRVTLTVTSPWSCPRPTSCTTTCRSRRRGKRPRRPPSPTATCSHRVYRLTVTREHSSCHSRVLCSKHIYDKNDINFHQIKPVRV